MTAVRWLATLAAGIAIGAAAQDPGTPASAKPAPGHRAPRAQLEVPGDGITLPLGDFGGRPVVDLRVQGQGPFKAVFDTGAAGTVIDSSIDEQLHLPRAEGLKAVAPGGGAPPVLVALPEASLGAAKITGLYAVILPLARMLPAPEAPRAVLSAAAFPGHLVTFDFAARTVTLRKGALPAADERTVFQYAEGDVLPMIPVRIGDVATRVHLDTGSPRGLTLPTLFMKRLPLTSEPKPAGKARTHSGEYPVFSARPAGPIVIGAHQVVAPEVLFSDVRPGGSAAPAQPAGNIGTEILREFVLTLDAANRRVRLEPKAAGAR